MQIILLVCDNRNKRIALTFHAQPVRTAFPKATTKSQTSQRFIPIADLIPSPFFFSVSVAFLAKMEQKRLA
jgi:hypothetical protein